MSIQLPNLQNPHYVTNKLWEFQTNHTNTLFVVRVRINWEKNLHLLTAYYSFKLAYNYRKDINQRYLHPLLPWVSLLLSKNIYYLVIVFSRQGWSWINLENDCSSNIQVDKWPRLTGGAAKKCRSLNHDHLHRCQNPSDGSFLLSC